MYKSIKLLNKEIKKARDKIIVIQSFCAHDNKVSVPKANTGNWDKSEDSYWTEHNCPDCLKFWTTEQ